MTPPPFAFIIVCREHISKSNQKKKKRKDRSALLFTSTPFSPLFFVGEKNEVAFHYHLMDPNVTIIQVFLRTINSLFGNKIPYSLQLLITTSLICVKHCN
jgi:hypothetical protein